MGHKRITEKDFWTCTLGNVPAQLQSTQLSTTKKSGEKYITVRDTATSSWIDFGCKRAMLIYAIIAAAVVVIAALAVGTGGAALIAIGAIAGLAGAAWGAVVGALLCGQLAAKARTWIETPKEHLTAVQGIRQVTGDCTMTCKVGGVISFAPQIKSWSQAVSLGVANYLGGLMEGMMAGAAIGTGGAAISGGVGAFTAGGMRGVGQAALQFAKSMPKNFYVNAIESVSKVGLALRGVMGVQNTAATYGNTGQAGIGDFAKGTVAMETGAYDSAKNIASGEGGWQDYVGMALMFSPVGKGKRELEEGLGNKADEADANKADEEAAPKAEGQDGEAPKQEGEHEAYEASRVTPESLNIDFIINKPELLQIFEEALNKLANSRSKSNAYKRYLEAVNNNFDGMTPKEIQALSEDAWSATRSKMTEVAAEKGVTIDGEIHHWNFPKHENPFDVLNPNQLTEPLSRDMHQQVHEATTSDPSNPWGGPIDPMHAIKPAPYNLPKPPVKLPKPPTGTN